MPHRKAAWRSLSGKNPKGASALLRMRLLLAIDGLKREFDAVFV